MAATFFAVAGITILFISYLWHVNRGLSGSPPDARSFPRVRWTPDDVRKGFTRTKNSPTDVSKHLLAKQGRRYIVAGGSGLVGGWIVRHLILRGEDPEAIRVLDLRTPTQPAILESKVQFIKTDVSSAESVDKGFSASWSSSRVSNLPITVFHTVAYINPAERKADFMSIYQAVNINGTENVLEAARKAGATCLIATSSGSIGILRKPTIMQTSDTLNDYSSCYAYSKAVAEKRVVSAHEPTGLQTGCIRPGHAIYGAGVHNVSSISWSYLSRGSSPTWLWDFVVNFVNAQNVSIAHLAYEKALLDGKDVGGKTYYVTDPSPPMCYGDLYTVLLTLAHKDTPCAFPKVPPAPLLLLGYFIEGYGLLRHRYLPFLPPITGDMGMLTPTMFNMSTVHVVFDDSAAKAEIGYDPPIGTMEGLCLQMLEWNADVEAGIIGKGGLAPRSGDATKVISGVVSGGASTTVPVAFPTNEKA